jgi:arylsulfatase A-like enzyme
MDDEYGRIIETLRELDVLDNTLVIFVSDHGDMLGDHDLMVKGAFFYDAGVRVPLILRWPTRIPRGTVTDTIVQPHQIARTVLEAAGIDEPFGSGETLFEELEQAGASRESAGTAVCLYRNAGIGEEGDYWDPPLHATMLRRGDYKLSVYHQDPGAGELYDLRSDPQELHNLWDVPAYAATRLQLTEELLDWFHREELQQCGSRGGDARPTAAQKIVNRGK